MARENRMTSLERIKLKVTKSVMLNKRHGAKFLKSGIILCYRSKLFDKELTSLRH